MGTYVELYTRYPDTVNEKWYKYIENEGKAKPLHDFMVYSVKVIEGEIAYIHSEPSMDHLSYIRTVHDWCESFPILIPGRGKFKLSGIDASDDLDQWEDLVMRVNFVVRNKTMFSKIEGLDAKTLEELMFPQELISMLESTPLDSRSENTSQDNQKAAAQDIFYCPDAWVIKGEEYACS